MENFGAHFESPEKKLNLEGISFVTSLGESFSQVKVDFPEKDLSIREAFPDKVDLKEIIEKAKEFKAEYPQTHNGILLGNPEIISAQDDSLQLNAEKLHYYVYFAAHQERQVKPEMGEQYAALSVCGVVYDSARNCFYMSVRPADSQEDPNKIDAPGGTLNPEFLQADPLATGAQRFEKKLGLKDLSTKSIGIERIFDSHYSLYNIAMYAEVINQQPQVAAEDFVEIPIAEAEDLLKSGRLTTPAKATLLLALSQDKFKSQGWGKEKVEKMIAI